MRTPRIRIRYADVAATLALVMAGGGTAYAVTMAPPNSVNTAAIVNGAVTTSKLAAEAVTSTKIAPGGVTRTTMRNDAVNAAKIQNDSVRLADLAGTDVTGAIGLNLSAHACGTVTLSVPGAAVGDGVLFSWTGSTTPAALLAGPGRVSTAGQVSMVFCNEGAAPLAFTDQGVRVTTFR